MAHLLRRDGTGHAMLTVIADQAIAESIPSTSGTEHWRYPRRRALLRRVVRDLIGELRVRGQGHCDCQRWRDASTAIRLTP